jgi:S1-C subfamily serine protease
VWSIRSLDDDGVPTGGAAFAVVEHLDGVGLITQLDIVRSATVSPAPPIELVKGDRTIAAELWAWDEANGLALVVTAEALPLLRLADPDEVEMLVGRSVFAMSGVGGRGSTASPGTLLDRSDQGVQHTAAIGSVFKGGPIVDSLGQVLGMTTTAAGDEFGDVAVGVDASAFCDRVLRCVNGLEVAVDN